ncbi:hypothetical protein ABDF71_09820 [Ochrobactrum sp. WV_118_8]|uniref:Uncharacterized protein n=1 Tax=Ochrobactrum soli TaxID=2448455 RepID=A0A2P9HMJ4_9HYPH|nr:hypothetical protein [[Ochrobactrum] soli]SPL65050.1 hypothetical protein OHAE_917 [[Ochrobactrum] soli]
MSLREFENQIAEYAKIVDVKEWMHGFDLVTVDTVNGHRMTLYVDETLDAIEHVKALAEYGIYAPNFIENEDGDFVEQLTDEDIEERLIIREEKRGEKLWSM